MAAARTSARVAARAGVSAETTAAAAAAAAAPPPPPPPPAPAPPVQVKKRKAEEASLPPSPPAKRRSPRVAATKAASSSLSPHGAPATTEPSTPPKRARASSKKHSFTSTPGWHRYHHSLSLMDPTPAMVRDDFAAIFGNNTNLESLLAMREPEVDSLGQIVHGNRSRAKEEKARRLETFLKKANRRKTAGARKDGEQSGARGRQQIQLKGANWVLFDPVRGYPPTLQSAPPAIFQNFEHYQPGNRKILAYNLGSFAIALKKTPESFTDCEVQYSKAGPKLVKSSEARDKADTTTA